jgi:hypothetical protein
MRNVPNGVSEMGPELWLPLLMITSAVGGSSEMPESRTLVAHRLGWTHPATSPIAITVPHISFCETSKHWPLNAKTKKYHHVFFFSISVGYMIECNLFGTKI